MVPSRAGWYTLVLRVLKPVAVEAKTLRTIVGEGLYVYVGSAGGPGGLRARVYRHFRRRKRVRWHIDRLTSSLNTVILAVAYCEGGYGVEVESKTALCLAGMGYKPLPGFGSTNDPVAPSHLFKAPRGRGVEEALNDSLDCLRRSSGSDKCSAITLPRYPTP